MPNPGDSLQVATGRGVTFAGVAFPNTDWSLNRSAGVIVMTNARDGVKRKKTLYDYSGSVNGFYDEDVPPGGTIKEGEVGTLFLSVSDDGSNGYSMTAILDGVSVVAGGQTEAMTVSFGFALESGELTDPS